MSSLHSVVDMDWPPQIGDPLPRAEAAWCTQDKWTEWILAEAGHGSEWNRVFRVTVENLDLVWESIALGVLTAPVTALRRSRPGFSCEVFFELRVDERVAFVVTAWHYSDVNAKPRLITAYPKPYTRGNGSYV